MKNTANDNRYDPVDGEAVRIFTAHGYEFDVSWSSRLKTWVGTMDGDYNDNMDGKFEFSIPHSEVVGVMVIAESGHDV